MRLYINPVRDVPLTLGERKKINREKNSFFRLSITKTERPRSANLLQMPRGPMCKLTQRARGYGGPAGYHRTERSLQSSPAQQLLGPPSHGYKLKPNGSAVCSAPDIAPPQTDSCQEMLCPPKSWRSVWVAPHRARRLPTRHASGRVWSFALWRRYLNALRPLRPHILQRYLHRGNRYLLARSMSPDPVYGRPTAGRLH